jgi:hypothetical protein
MSLALFDSIVAIFIGLSILLTLLVTMKEIQSIRDDLMILRDRFEERFGFKKR